MLRTILKKTLSLPVRKMPLISGRKSLSTTSAIQVQISQKPVVMSAWQQATFQKLQKIQSERKPTPFHFLWGVEGVDIFLKNETLLPTGSLKDRLALALILQGILKNKIHAGMTLVEASSGSTARAEAALAKELGLKFKAVMCKGTPQEKIDAIVELGGEVVICEPGKDIEVAIALGKEEGCYFLNQFENASTAIKEKNIAQELFMQHDALRGRAPNYVVCCAGTGGTSATLGAHMRLHKMNTQLIVGDPENSAFYGAFRLKDSSHATGICSRIGGIGRPYVSSAFKMEYIDDMMPVLDVASWAAMEFLFEKFNIDAGPSTGTNLYVCFELMKEMLAQGCREGSVVSLVCDGGKFYRNTPDWVKKDRAKVDVFKKDMNDFYSFYSRKKPVFEPLLPGACDSSPKQLCRQ